MEAFKDLMYAGLGLAKETETKVKHSFSALVEKGKQADQEGNNVINDFFKTVDTDVVQFLLEKAEAAIQKHKK